MDSVFSRSEIPCLPNSSNNTYGSGGSTPPAAAGRRGRPHQPPCLGWDLTIPPSWWYPGGRLLARRETNPTRSAHRYTQVPRGALTCPTKGPKMRRGVPHECPTGCRQGAGMQKEASETPAARSGRPTCRGAHRNLPKPGNFGYFPPFCDGQGTLRRDTSTLRDSERTRAFQRPVSARQPLSSKGQTSELKEHSQHTALKRQQR